MNTTTAAIGTLNEPQEYCTMYSRTSIYMMLIHVAQLIESKYFRDCNYKVIIICQNYSMPKYYYQKHDCYKLQTRTITCIM